jgi:trans-aconitate 2-methyltransferase
MADWSASLYLRFAEERTRPARDLLAAVPGTDVRRAVDLGCGPGNSTELLAKRFPQAEVEGVDSSLGMLEAARELLPGVRFEQADIATWRSDGPIDLIFANAVLQWLPDRATLLTRLAGMLAEGGSLAVQMPDNLDEPSHRLMREVAALPAFRAQLGNAEGIRTAIAPASDLYALLKPLCRHVDIWRTTYHHPLDGVEGVVDWLRATGLRPFLQPLSEADRASFLDAYREQLGRAYPLAPDDKLLLPFPRLFLVATR